MTRTQFPADVCEHCGGDGTLYGEGELLMAICRHCRRRYVTALTELTPEGRRRRNESRGRIASLYAETWAYRRGAVEGRNV